MASYLSLVVKGTMSPMRVVLFFAALLAFDSISQADFSHTIFLTLKEKQIGNATIRLRAVSHKDGYTLYRGNISSRRTRSNPQNVAAISTTKNNKKILKINFLLPNNTSERSMEIILDQNNKVTLRSAPQRALSSKSCGSHKALPALVSSSSNKSNTFKTLAVSSNAKYSATLAIDCDEGCVQSLGVDGSTSNEIKAKIAQFVNVINTIYERDVTITLDLVTVTLRTNPNIYPSSIQDAETLLNTFRQKAPELGAADIKQLLTSLRNIPDGVAGLTYVGAACRDSTFNVGWSQHFNSLFTPYILAHEIAHSLGAEHDPQNFGIMAAVLNQPLPNSFSTFSKNQVASNINALGRQLCFDLLNSSKVPTPTPIPSVNNSNAGSIDGAVTNSTEPRLKTTTRISKKEISTRFTFENMTSDTCQIVATFGRSARESRNTPLITISPTKTIAKSITLKTSNSTLLKKIPVGKLEIRVQAICSNSTLSSRSTLRLNGSKRNNLKNWIIALGNDFSS